MNSTKSLTRGMLVAMLCGGFIGLTPALAEGIPADKAEAVIKYRQHVMDTMGGLTGIASGQLRDGFTFGPDLSAVAAALVAVTADIPALFPAGSDFGETDALPKVWADAEGFAASARESADAAGAFAAALKAGDKAAIASAMQKVGQSCKGCHSDYRSDD